MRIQVSPGQFVEGVSIIPALHSVFDNTANDSDKSWVVPNNEIWLLNWAHVLFQPSATPGNRLLKLEVQDGSANTMLDDHSGYLQPTGVDVHYMMMQGIYRETTPVNNEIQFPIPQDLYIEPGWTMRFYDSNAIDAAADDMTVAFQVQKFVV